ncbi:MAG: hypothetical protein WC713_07945, partial [Candidatus Methylomirabilota bacterium]
MRRAAGRAGRMCGACGGILGAAALLVLWGFSGAAYGAGPVLQTAVANNSGHDFVDTDPGDQVVLTFDQSTTGLPEITTANINTVLALSNGHTWGTIQSATWSTVTHANDTLTITFGAGLRSVWLGDTITVGTDTIENGAGEDATGSPEITESFGTEEPEFLTAQASAVGDAFIGP